jgi:CheY-like chemotaxis protein
MTGDPPSSGTGVPNRRDPPRTEPCTQPRIEAVRRDSYTILVIDDDVAFQQFVSSVLIRHGFTVLVAFSGLRGLDMLSCDPWDIQVVLLDYTMPELDGAKTLQHLRNLNPSIKVVAVTASKPQLVTPDFREGVDSYIVKPIHARQLIETIDSLVGSKPPGSKPGSLESNTVSSYRIPDVRAAGAPWHANGCCNGDGH